MKKIETKSLAGAVFAVLFILSQLLIFKKQYAGDMVVNCIAGILGSVFLFDILVRKIPRFEPYFKSRYNIFTARIRYRQEFDFSPRILFDKFMEVIPESGFKVIKADENSGDIFAISPISWFSWGENIYISIKEVNGKTKVDFCSVCIFQMYSWGKNKRNHEKFLDQFEKSLVI